MSDVNDPGDVPQLRRSTALDSAKTYFEAVARFGAEGQPSMLEMGEQQQHHAELARTAALVSMADSLDRLVDESNRRVQLRRLNQIQQDLHTLAAEFTKIRYVWAKGLK